MPGNNSYYTPEIREQCCSKRYDNSCMESFFASLKKEYFYGREYATIDDVRRDLFYI